MAALVQRVLFSGVAVFAVCSFGFFLIYMVPGSPVDLMLGESAPMTERLTLERQLGLDRPLPVQYASFMGKLLKGDLGRSLHSGMPVSRHLRESVPVTFLLALSAMLLAAVWGIGAGGMAVLKGGRVEQLLNIFSLVCMSLPVFFVAPLLIWLFAIHLGWFPVSETGPGGVVGLRYMALPALSLAIPLGAVLLKITRAALIEVIPKHYMRTAKAKGLSRPAVFLKHGFKNALVSIVTVLGLQSSALLTGTVIVESIFDLPGIGLLLLESIQRRDYPLVQGAIILIAVIYVMVNLITDLIYLHLNPQIRSV